MGTLRIYNRLKDSGKENYDLIDEQTCITLKASPSCLSAPNIILAQMNNDNKEYLNDVQILLSTGNAHLSFH